MGKTSKKQSPARRSAPPAPEADPAPMQPREPDPDKQSTLRVFLEVLRVPVQPARTMMDFITRLAFWSVLLSGTVVATSDRAGVLVAYRLVDFLGVLLVAGAADQWVVRLVRWMGRRWRH